MVGGTKNLYYASGNNAAWLWFPSETTPYPSKTENEGTGNSENLPPYITCYMWKRVA